MAIHSHFSHSHFMPPGTSVGYAGASGSYDVMYPCGHTINIPTAAIAAAGTGGKYAPSRCPTCEHSNLSLKWLHQEEAKLWNQDPNWLGFPVQSTAATLSRDASTANPYWVGLRTGPLAWLDFQLERVTRRAFS